MSVFTNMSDVLAHCPDKGRCNDCVTIRLLFTSNNRNHIILNPGVSADNLIVMCIIIENHLIICMLPGIYLTPLSLTPICICIMHTEFNVCLCPPDIYMYNSHI